MTEESPAVKYAREIKERAEAMPQQPNMADVHVMGAKLADLVRELKRDQELRKWCVQEARQVVVESVKPPLNGEMEAAANVNFFSHELSKALTEYFYNFVTGQTQKVIEVLEK